MDWDVLWTDNAVQTEFVGKMQHHQKVNHIPGMFCLSRKDHLGRNLMKMQKKFPQEYKFFPQTWILPSELVDLRSQYEKGKVKIMIVKPQASCQGKGIFLTRRIEDLSIHDHYVVQ